MEEPRHDHLREHETQELDTEQIRARESRRVEAPPPRPPRWSPAQVVALGLGIFFLVLGGVALARGGFADLTAHTSVAGFHHTSILGLIEVVLGFSLLGIGAVPGAERSGMVFVGALLLAFGIVLILQAESFHRVLGTHRNNGWLYALLSGLAVATALWAPGPEA